MNRIFKYEIEISGDDTEIEMPKGSTPISIQMQFGKICMWVVVDEVKIKDEDTERRLFTVVGTGHRFDADGLNYLSTVQYNGLVWHVFEVR